MKIVLEHENVDPSKARRFLDTSKLNRTINDKVVNEYAALMARDAWQPYPPIEFNENEELVNGHHRLEAVIRAESTVKLFIVHGVTPEMHSIFDTGKPRSLHDLFKMYRPTVDYDQYKAGAVRLAAWLLSGSQQRIRNLVEYDLWAKPFKPAIEWLIETKIAVPPSLTALSPITGAFAFAYKADPDKITKLAKQVLDGANLKPMSPALALHNLITRPKADRSNVQWKHSYRIVVARQVLNLIRAYLHNETVNRVTSDDGGRQFFLDNYSKKVIKMNAIEDEQPQQKEAAKG